MSDIDAGVLGQFEGIVSFCSLSNPPAAGSYRTSLNQLTGGLGDKILDETRETAAYRQSFKGINELLEGIPRDQRKQACASFFAH
jgi:hypothetical protein